MFNNHIIRTGEKMKIIKEKPIDELYMIELEDLAKFYECDIEFALKQAISIQHSNIKGFQEALKMER